jgi:hypothetical protein
MEPFEYTFLSSAFKHGIDEESMLNAICNPLGSLQHPNEDVKLVIGFDVHGFMIEVAYNYKEGVVFHAMRTKRGLKG